MSASDLFRCIITCITDTMNEVLLIYLCSDEDMLWSLLYCDLVVSQRLALATKVRQLFVDVLPVL